jgi:dipeptidase
MVIVMNMFRIYKNIWLAFLLIASSYVYVPVNSFAESTEDCTVMIAGKNTTVDGSILFVKTEDDGRREVDFLWRIPRKIHEQGSLIKLQADGSIPQVPETYAYFWDECPGTSYSNGIVNEWGVAFGSNGCASKEDPVDVVEARGDLVNGGLGFKFRMILAERSRTAREAVELAAELLDEYGYNASGRNLNIVGPKEAWQLQMVRGMQYVARRVRDDEVAIIANTFSIREVDMNDRKNFICSPRLIEYAVQRGWYDPSGGEPFDFAKTYAPEKIHKSPSNTRRQWNMARLLDKDFPITWKQAQDGILPVSVKPDRKLSLKNVMTIFRNHYEGITLDESEGYSRSPHKTHHTICNYGSHRTTVVQQRDWLPVEIGTVYWRALDQPCSSVFVPWYAGIHRIPEAFRKAPESLYTTKRSLLDFHFHCPPETWALNLESASGVFTLLGQMVDADYGVTIDHVRKVWGAFEASEFALQAWVERTALELYEKDTDLAKEFLTLYSNAQALKSLEIARDLIDEIKRHAWGSGNPRKMEKAEPYGQ